MSPRILAPVLLAASLAAVGAQGRPGPAAPLTEAQRSALRKEVHAVTRAWLQAIERSDGTAVLALCASVPDFPLACADAEGKLLDFDGFRKITREGCDGAAHVVVTLRREMFTVLDADTALWAFQGGWQRTMKTGAILRTEDRAVSLLFRRVGKAWKIAYQHESSPAPVEVKPADSPDKGR